MDPHLVLARSHLLLVLLVLGATTPARAHTTTVPDEFPTIQAALDWIGMPVAPETLLVRPGDYAEVPEVHFDIVVRGLGTDASDEPSVTVAGLRACYVEAPLLLGIHFERLHITGPVQICPTNGPILIAFRDCRFDADVTCLDLLSYPDLSDINLKHCKVRGATSLRALELTADSTTFGGPLLLHGDYDVHMGDDRVDVDSGIAATVIARDAVIVRNVVHGGLTGIAARVDEGNAHVEDNRVEDCAGDGIHVDANYYKAYVERDTVLRAGGAGLRVIGIAEVRDNRVLGCSGTGLDLDHLDDAAVVEGNVVGRCGGHGIMVSQYTYGYQASVDVTGNTVYACSGAGFQLQDMLGGAVTRNLAVGNHEGGLSVVRGVPLSLDCNDWFANDGGATSGVSPSATDLAVDPRFCDVAADDVQLMVDSRLLHAPHCGVIGALGNGCDPRPGLPPDPPHPTPADPVLAIRAAHVDGVGNGLRVAFTLADASPARLELLDVAGRLVVTRDLGAAGPGEHEVQLAADGRLAQGIYFLRIRQGAGEARTRAAIIR